MTKYFKLTKEDIKQLVYGYGGCIATDRITVDGFPVRFMYREQPDKNVNCGYTTAAFTTSPESVDFVMWC